jgi:murein L,D-transpeptidase YafK
VAWFSGEGRVEAGNLPRLAKADEILVLKSQRTLILLRAGKAIRSYRVALGPSPSGPKTREGDGRTPEGRYVVDWRNTKSRFYRSLHISYPGRKDQERARALGVPLGSAIMIHGLPNGRAFVGADHAKWDWTEGCIAVTNAEMDEIWVAVDDGTPIEIRP